MILLKQKNITLSILLLCRAMSSAAGGGSHTPLHDAIKSNQESLADALNAVNDLLSKKTIDLSLQDSDGNTALHEALIQSQNLQGDDLINVQKAYYYQIAVNIIDAVVRKYPQKQPPPQWWHRFFRRKFLTRGQVLSIKNSLGQTPLYLAAEAGVLEVVKKLCEHGALDFDHTTNPHSPDTPLQVAEKNNHQAIINFLTNEAKDSSSLHSLHIAAKNGNIKYLKILLKHNANMNAITKDKQTALHFAASHGQPDAIYTILNKAEGERKNNSKILLHIRDLGGYTPLHYAVLAQQNIRQTIATLYLSGARLNAKSHRGLTPLDFAKQNKAKEAIKTLEELSSNTNTQKIKWSADVTIDDSHKTIQRKNQSDKQPEEENENDKQLLEAAENGTADEVQKLINAGADIHCVNSNGETPLHLAAIAGNSEILERLYQAAKNKDDLLKAIDKKGNTPLHFAVYSERNTEAVIKKLIEFGADPLTKNFRRKNEVEGKTPEGLANEINLQLSPDVFTQSQKQPQENNGNNINIIYPPQD